MVMNGTGKVGIAKEGEKGNACLRNVGCEEMFGKMGVSCIPEGYNFMTMKT